MELHFHSYASCTGSVWVVSQLSDPHSGQGFQNEMLFFLKGLPQILQIWGNRECILKTLNILWRNTDPIYLDVFSMLWLFFFFFGNYMNFVKNERIMFSIALLLMILSVAVCWHKMTKKNKKKKWVCSISLLPLDGKK